MLDRVPIRTPGEARVDALEHCGLHAHCGHHHPVTSDITFISKLVKSLDDAFTRTMLLLPARPDLASDCLGLRRVHYLYYIHIE